jgi:dihydropteroate synthase
MLDTVAEMGVPIVLMHIQNTPETMQNAPYYHSVTREVFHFLNERIRTAQDKGIKTVIADVGIGFGKSLEHNSELLSRLDEFKCLSVPLLIGVSRKSLIGKATGLQVQERDAMTCVLEFNAMQKGAAIIRTHNYHNALNLIKIFEFVE